MPFYEVIYENGQFSVMNCDSDEEAAEGLKEQHRRAVNGEAGGPDGRNANRISKVFVYDVHPNEYNPSQELNTKDAAAATKNSTTAPEMIIAIQAAVHPMESESGPHESNFKMESTGELDSTTWEGE
jgi:hypothetical protein